MPLIRLPRHAFGARSLPAVLIAVQLIALQAVSAATSPSGSVTLYDQTDVSALGGASPTQQTGSANDEIADDFEVADPEGWTVAEVRLSLDFVDMNNTPPGQPPYLIAFYADEAGSPAGTATCEYDSAPGVTDDTLPGASMNVSVILPKPCRLSVGRYWMAMSVVLAPPPYSLWTYNAPSSSVLSEPKYRNPDNTWGTGCIDWTPAYSGGCLINPSTGMPNMVFQLLGSVGSGDRIFSNGFES